MKDQLSSWIEGFLIPSLQLWPSETYWVLGCSALSVVLFAGTLARLCLKLPLPSEQGLIALAAMIFLGTMISMSLSFFAQSLTPILVGGVISLLLCVPAYLIGTLSERAEPVLREAVGMPPAPVRLNGGVRAIVIKELKAQKIDQELLELAKRHAGPRESKVMPTYIGLRSRAISKDLNRRKKAQDDQGLSLKSTSN